MRVQEIYQAMAEGNSVIAKVNGEMRQCIITFIWTSEAFKGYFELEDCVTKKPINQPIHYRSIKCTSLYHMDAKYYYNKEKSKIA